MYKFETLNITALVSIQFSTKIIFQPDVQFE